MHWLYLTIAIVAEVAGGSALKLSQGFTRLGPSTFAVLGFGVALFFLALALRTLPLGIAYAVWAGSGTALITLLGVVIFRQPLDLAGCLGIALIVSGVVVINTLSKAVYH